MERQSGSMDAISPLFNSLTLNASLGKDEKYMKENVFYS